MPTPFVMPAPMQICESLPRAIVDASVSFSNSAMDCDSDGSHRAADAYEAWASKLCNLAHRVDYDGLPYAEAYAQLQHWADAPEYHGPVVGEMAAFIRAKLSPLF